MNPQTPNQAPFFGRKISKTGVNVTQATNNQLILKEDYDQGNTIYYDDSGIPNVLIGKRPLTGIRGFYVAQIGIDVRTATDNQLIFNSQQDTFKIVQKGTIIIPSFSMPGSGNALTSITIPHNLPFTPLVQVYVQANLVDQFLSPVTSSYVPLPVIASQAAFTSYFIPGAGGISNYEFNAIYGINSTDLIIQIVVIGQSSPDTIQAIPVTYFLLQETAH